MKKYIFRAIICLFTCAVAIMCIACDSATTNDHMHTFGTEWNNDAIAHWHECVSGDGEKSDYAAHDFGDDVIIKSPTYEEAGLKTNECTICGYVKTSVIPALVHTHTYGGDWQSNDEEHWLECECGEKSGVEEHQYVVTEIVKEATSVSYGTARLVCSVCSYEKVAEIAPHTHVDVQQFDNDDTYHWFECDDCYGYKYQSTHTFGDVNVLKKASATETGLAEHTCSICDYKQEFVLAISSECTHEDKDGDFVCDYCDYDGPIQIEKDVYINSLWNATHCIGKEAISSTDNISLSLDVSLAVLSLKDKKVVETESNIGVKCDVIIDRGETSENSAIRFEVYDVTTNDVMIGIYYFVDEPNIIYLDFNYAKDIDVLKSNDILQQRYYKIAFDTDGDHNATYPTALAEYIRNHVFNQEYDAETGDPIEDTGFTLVEILDALANNTGADWTLNSLIQNIAGVFDLDLANLLRSVQNLLNTKLVDEQGNIHIENAFKTNMVKGFIKKPVGSIDPIDKDRRVYAADMNISGLLNTIGSMIPEEIAKYVNSQTDINLSFGEKNGEIDKFVAFIGIKSEKNTNGIYPGIEFSINNLEIRKAPTDKEVVYEKMGFDGSKWNSSSVLEFAPNLEMYVEIDNVRYLCNVEIDGDVEKIADFIIDMMNVIDLTEEQLIEKIKAIDLTVSVRLEELDSSNEKTGNVLYQIMVSCHEARIEITEGDNKIVIDETNFREVLNI